ncbi:hypothetical protein [Streptomyces omiyaensis]|uniref:hypothetical protein n=1 Tax=Streptomyces omiyaensis TaxID=68247 RepID=UPI0036F9038C
MRCIDCTELATHRGRCKTHHAVYEGRPAIRQRSKHGDDVERLGTTLRHGSTGSSSGRASPGVTGA